LVSTEFLPPPTAFVSPRTSSFAKRLKLPANSVYLQFDGVSEEKNKHRGVGNLFDVKQQAIETCPASGSKSLSLRPSSIRLTMMASARLWSLRREHRQGADYSVPARFLYRSRRRYSDALRIKQRYTLAGMTHDLKDQLRGQLQPLRDWYPLSSYSAFTSVMDMLQGADAPWGWSSCNCHPNCGIFTLMVVTERPASSLRCLSF